MSDLIGAEYSLTQVTAVVGGVPILGGLSDDAITIEPTNDLYDVFEGPDGHTVFNKTNKTGFLVTISVMETSKAYPLLMAALELSLVSLPGVPKLLPVIVRDNLSGEQLLSGSGVFLRRPDMTKGPTATARAFQLHVVAPQIAPAPLNLTR